MMLLPTKSTRSGVSTGDFFTTGAGSAWLSAAVENRTNNSAAHSAAIGCFVFILLTLPGIMLERPGLLFPGHHQLHRADTVDRALEMVAVRELGHAGGRAGGEQRAGLERRHARKEADKVAQAVDHVRCVRLHHDLAVLLDVDAQVLRLANLVAGDDPGTEPAERVEAFADVARIVPAFSPGVADADVPAQGIAVDMVERALRGDLP